MVKKRGCKNAARTAAVSNTAMSQAKLPTLAGSILEIIQDGINGYLYGKGDIKGASEIIYKVYTKEIDFQKITTTAVETARESYAIENTARNIRALYLTSLNK